MDEQDLILLALWDVLQDWEEGGGATFPRAGRAYPTFIQNGLRRRGFEITSLKSNS